MRQGRIIVNPPKYPPEFWSVSSRTELGFPRTQNAIESWHNRFNILVGECHPNPYSLVEEFRKEEHSVSVEIKALCLSGGFSTNRRRKYLDREAKLIEVLENRSSMNTMEFLDKIVHRLKLTVDVYST